MFSIGRTVRTMLRGGLAALALAAGSGTFGFSTAAANGVAALTPAARTYNDAKARTYNDAKARTYNDAKARTYNDAKARAGDGAYNVA
jgi:hypothetical protein